MQIAKINLLFLLLALFSLPSCEPDDSKALPVLTIPTSYDSTNFIANATTEKAVLSNVKALVDEIKKGRISGTVLNNTTLQNLFIAGNPNLPTVGSAYYSSKIQGTNGWLEEISKASGGIYIPGPPVGQGGVYGGYLFDENGLEPEQLVEKGQFGSVFFKHFNDLSGQTLTSENLDRMLAIYGSNPRFPNSPTAAKTPRPDAFFAVYACRRDKNDGNGYYSKIKNNFLTLRGIVNSNNQFITERDKALAEIRTNWEKINAATIVNYCHAIVSTMSKTAPTDADKASALHALSECIAFTHGYRTLDQSKKIITDAQIDQALVLLQAPADGTPTCYKVVISPETELAKISQVITLMKSIYGFSDAEIEDFKKNWVNEQGR
jgi:hypothetical protein